jgi:hypothetical protein
VITRWHLVAVALGAATTGCEAIFGVDFDDAHPVAGAGGATGHGWTELTLVNGDDGVPHATTDFVRAIWCSALDVCVVATEGASFEPGNVYAATHREVTAIVVEGHRIASDTAFIGLSPTPDGVMARINRTEPLVMTSGDITSPEGWNALEMGDLGELEGALNTQLWFQMSAAGSQLAVTNVVLTSATAPGASAVWSPLWAPPTVPSNYFDLLLQDPTLCHDGPATTRGPAGWVSDDLQEAIYPVGAAVSDHDAGSCASVDGGQTFHFAALPSEIELSTPSGLRCLDAGRCWIFGDGSLTHPAYLYYSTGTLEVGLTWTRAQIPDGPEREIEDIAFAPDGEHGWAAGVEAPGRGLLLATEDGGRTWSDNLIGDVAAFEDARLLSVFALDESNIWVGGENGLLMSNGRAGRE